MMQLRLGTKGEIVIPKKIREHLGFSRDSPVLLEIKDKTIHIKAMADDIVKNWEERAKKSKVNVSTWVYGDKLYEEVF